jgi:GPH family glycoside/pentoside/hexuronide:cation symporter
MTGLMIITQAFNGYYMFYYVDHLGLVVTLASIINVIYAIWDAVNDPLVGYLSDNTRSRWGRRRPWLLAGLPFLLAFIILYFSVPNAFRQGMALFWYALIMLFLYETASTIMITNYTALFPELFQKFSIRARASAFTQGFGMGGELLGFSLAPILYNQFGFIGMALVISALTGILLIIPIAKVREDPRSQELSKFDMKEALRDVVRDKPFWHFTVVATLVLMTTGIMTLAIPFWAKYTLHASPKAPALIFFVGFGFAILTVAPWSKMVRKWGTKRMWVWAISIMILAAIENGFANTLLSGLIGALLTGVALGGVKVCREMLLALFVDRNLNRTGHRREGIYYSLTRFFARLSRIIESLSLVLLGVIFGYFSGESPGPHPENAFRFLMSVMPLIFLIPAWIMARRLPLGMEHEEAGA